MEARMEVPPGPPATTEIAGKPARDGSVTSARHAPRRAAFAPCASGISTHRRTPGACPMTAGRLRVNGPAGTSVPSTDPSRALTENGVRIVCEGQTWTLPTQEFVSMPRDSSPLILSREDLYELVWSKPLTELAQDFGISDVALAKRLRRLHVPVPGRGYWARVAAGQALPRPALPTRDRPSPDRKALTVPAPRVEHAREADTP